MLENEDYIYISEIHPVPDLWLGEACSGSAQSSHFLSLCSFGFLSRMSLGFRKRQEGHKSQAKPSCWLAEMIGGLSPRDCMVITSREIYSEVS